ncbi:MAG: PorT family protein [Chlorobi bacterium]|nr:PorT family protein [Chlorobiota bacterium]
MKKISFLSLILVFGISSVTNLYSQENNEKKGNIKNIIEVEENPDKTTVNILGGKLEVNNYSDTVTAITLGRNKFEVIEEHNRGRLRMVRLPVTKFKGHFTGIDLGFNGYMASGFTTVLPPEGEFMDLHNSKSLSVGLNFLQYSIPFQRNKNTIGAVIGASWTFYNYRTDNNYIIELDDDGNTTGRPEENRTVTKNKLTTSYINFPFLFEFQIPTNKDNNRFFISAGPYAGFLVKGHTKVVYEDNGTKSKEKYKGDLNLNPFQYGVMVRMGYRWIKFFASYNFSTLYMDGKGPELYPYSIGFTLVNF